MARKKTSNLYIMIGAAFAVVVVVVAIVVGLLVHAAADEDESSSSDSSSVSDSDESEDSSKPDESEGPAGPMLPDIDDESTEDDPDESEEDRNSEDVDPSSSQSSSIQSSSAQPSKSSEAPKPSSSVPSQTVSSKPSSSQVSSKPPASSSSKITSSSSKPSSTASSSSSSSKAVVVKPSSSSKSSTTSKSSGTSSQKEKLETPLISVSCSNGVIKVTWDEVDNASGYKVDIYEGDVGTGSTAKPVESARLDYFENVYNSEDVDVVTGDTYTVKVQALGGDDYNDSNLRRATVTGKGGSSGGLSSLKRLKTPENLSSDLDYDVLTIYWDNVSNADKYTVELYDPSGELIESDTTENTEYTFSEELTIKGSYKAQVRAEPKKSSGYNPSSYASKSIKITSGTSGGSSTRLAAPSFSIKRYKDYTAIQWTDVKNADRYYLEILNPSGGIEHEYTIDAYEDKPYEWYGDMVKKGTWKFRMKAIDDDGEYNDSTFTTKSIEIGAGELEVPTITDVTTSGKSVTIYFEAVDDADSYRFSITGKANKTQSYTPSGITASKKEQSCRITSLSSGDYHVKVRAVSNSSSIDDSDWSSEYDFTID